MSIEKQLDALRQAVESQEKPVTKKEMQELLESVQSEQQASEYRSVTEKPVIVDVMNISDAAAKKLAGMLSQDDESQSIEIEQTEQSAPMSMIGKLLKFAKEMFIKVLKLVGDAVGWLLTTITDILGKLTDWVLSKIKQAAMIAIAKSASTTGRGFKKLRLVSAGLKLASVTAAGIGLANFLDAGEKVKESLGTVNKAGQSIFSSPESMISSGFGSAPNFTSLGETPTMSTDPPASGGDSFETPSVESSSEPDLESDLPADQDTTQPASLDQLESTLKQQDQQFDTLQLDPDMSQEDMDYNNVIPLEAIQKPDYDKLGTDQLDRIGGTPTPDIINLNLDIPKNLSVAPSAKSSDVMTSTPSTAAPTSPGAPSSPVRSSSAPVDSNMRPTPAAPATSPRPPDPPATSTGSAPAAAGDSVQMILPPEQTMEQTSGQPMIASPILDSLNAKIDSTKPLELPAGDSISIKSTPQVNIQPSSTGSTTQPAQTTSGMPRPAMAAPVARPNQLPPAAAIQSPTQTQAPSNLSENIRLASESLRAARESTQALRESLDNKNSPAINTLTTVADKTRTPDINSTHGFRESVHNGI